ncbi:MAG: flagellar export protein FliJ [Syntrophorhabdaceae bacterium]
MDKKRIDKIIEIKERLKKDKEREVEEANVRMTGIYEQIAALEKNANQNYDMLCGTTLAGNDFTVITDYIESLDVSKAGLVCEGAAMQETLDELQQELYEFAKELKMLSKLREKVMKETKKSENRREQKILDEIALRSENKTL